MFDNIKATEELKELINVEYVFPVGYEDSVNKDLTELFCILQKIDDDKEYYQVLKDGFRKIGDPHLTIMQLSTLVYCANFKWDKECLYLDNYEVTAINNSLIGVLMQEYKDRYNCHNKIFMQNYVIEDLVIGQYDIEGTTTITVIKDDRRHEIKLEKIQQVQTVDADFIDKISFYEKKDLDKNTTYLKINNFTKPIDTNSFSANNLIIDLRENMGGYVENAINFLSRFTENKLYNDDLIIVGKDEIATFGFGGNDNQIKIKNIYVLINHNTMSCAEYIVAYNLIKVLGAISIGEPTGGISGQASKYVINQSALLCITTKRYVSKTGVEYRNGITPKYIIANKEDALKLALEIIRRNANE